MSETTEPSTAVPLDDANQRPNLRFGLIGVGRWGQCHARALSDAKDAVLVAVAASREDSAKRAGEEFGVPAFADYSELLAADLDIDVVTIAAPNALHAEIALAALNTNHHVLIEKPMATQVADGQAIVDAAAAARLHVTACHELRYSPLWGQIKREIDAGRVGTPYSAAFHLWRRPYRGGSGNWRFDQGQVGSWILEEPVHYFDLARWYLESSGEPRSVYARVSGDNAAMGATLSSIITFPEGGMASVSGTVAGAGHHVVTEIVGTEGALRLVWSGESDHSLAPQFSLHFAHDTSSQAITIESVPTEVGSLTTLIESFARNLVDDVPMNPTATDALWAVRIALAAEESARSEREIAL